MTTQHTCGGPVFGKRTPGCPRCEELAAGAEPVRWRRNDDDAQRVRSLDAHFASERHRSGGCGPVCTFGDW